MRARRRPGPQHTLMTENAPAPIPPVVCPRCEHTMRRAVVSTAIWRGGRLFVIEDIPAEICDSCMEQFYDEDTTEALRRLAEDFSAVEPRREILVPVYSLDGRIVRAAPPHPEDLHLDY